MHELAEQLEHIESTDLVDRLADFLGNPSFDPHGDPIPDKKGKIKTNTSIPLTKCEAGKNYKVANLADTSDAFLQYLGKLNILPGTKLKMIEQYDYDNSFSVEVEKKAVQLSEKVAKSILVISA